MSDYTKNELSKSMHIVVFTGGEFPEPKKTGNYWKNTKAPDFIIAADSGLNAAEQYAQFWKDEYNFTPNIILGDMDSLADSESRLKKYPKDKVILHNPYKNYTDTELAIQYAIENVKCSEKKFITLLGGDGGRVDHLLGIFDLFSTELHPDAWLCQRQVLWYAASKTEFQIFGLELSDYISIARENSVRSGGIIKDEGLEWGCDKFRKEGMPSISNRISQKFHELQKPVKISFLEGNFIVILPITSKTTISKI